MRRCKKTVTFLEKFDIFKVGKEMLDFKIIRHQSTVFTPDPYEHDKVKLANVIKEATDNLFDGESAILPLPPEAPPDIPRISLMSKSEEWKIDISNARMNFFFLKRKDMQAEEPSLLAFFEQGLKIYRALNERYLIRYQRLAGGVQRVAVIEGKLPSEYLPERFSKAEFVERGPFNRSARFELHNLKKYKPAWFSSDVNSWVRVQSAVLEGTEEPVVSILNDINTLSEQRDANFSQETLVEFFTNLPAEMETILTLYFGS